MMVFDHGWSEDFDGPGRRWVIYLKGCNFRCRWCANPESLRGQTELLFYPARGTHPEWACPYGAVNTNGRGVALARDVCAVCEDQACARVWKHPAYVLAGSAWSVARVVKQAREASPLFGAQGGVTFGGGEPTLQTDELVTALQQLRKAGIHTAVETNASTEGFPRVMCEADLLICDLKCVSAGRHREWTQADNGTVLANLERAAREAQALWMRVPLVPGLNTDAAEMDRMAEFLGGLAQLRPELRVDVLRLHHLGEPKYAALGRDYPIGGTEVPGRETAEALVGRLVGLGVRAYLAS